MRVLSKMKRAVGLKGKNDSDSSDDELTTGNGGRSLRTETLHSQKQAPTSPWPPSVTVDGGPRRSFRADITGTQSHCPVDVSPTHPLSHTHSSTPCEASCLAFFTNCAMARAADKVVAMVMQMTHRQGRGAVAPCRTLHC